MREITQRWYDALLSGDYQQGTGSLVDDYFDDYLTFCCLGVLYHVVTGKNPPLGEGFLLPVGYKSSLELFEAFTLPFKESEGAIISEYPDWLFYLVTDEQVQQVLDAVNFTPGWGETHQTASSQHLLARLNDPPKTSTGDRYDFEIVSKAIKYLDEVIFPEKT